LMILHEQSRLQLYDPVAAYLPSFGKVTVWNGMPGSDSCFVPLTRPITVRDLLTHTSGLTY
jgi:CubicO group peptidase (beta-lactamase class C family)